CRSAPTVSDAARIAHPCEISSKWTPNTSCSPRCMRWWARSPVTKIKIKTGTTAVTASVRNSWKRQFAISASIRRNATRRLVSSSREAAGQESPARKCREGGSGTIGSRKGRHLGCDKDYRGTTERMAKEFKLPELGENIESGDLVRLMIKPGASIAEGEPVMELETDKAVVEVPSSVTGTIGKIHVKEGDKLQVGQVIFTVENGAGTGTRPASKTEKPAAPPTAVPAVQASAPPAKLAPTSSAATASEFKLPELGENIDSGDLVRLMIAPGATVFEGQPVMELETDKAVVEVPSSVTGVVREIKVKEGQKVKVGEVIFTLEGGVTHVEPVRRHEPVEHISGQQAARLA